MTASAFESACSSVSTNSSIAPPFSVSSGAAVTAPEWHRHISAHTARAGKLENECGWQRHGMDISPLLIMNGFGERHSVGAPR